MNLDRYFTYTFYGFHILISDLNISDLFQIFIFQIFISGGVPKYISDFCFSTDPQNVIDIRPGLIY